jgi:hypothetical protein
VITLSTRRCPGILALIGSSSLNGDVLVISADGEYSVKFEVREAEVSVFKPHGLKYSLTLHGPGNRRLVGFDMLTCAASDQERAA